MAHVDDTDHEVSMQVNASGKPGAEDNERFPVTLVLVGVGLTEAGLFTEGRTQRESTLAQTARRTTRLTVEPFANTNAGQKQWRSVLHAIEQRVVLVKHRDGTLSEDLADYLYARTSGHIGSLMTLINRTSSRAIRTGTEALTEQLLDATPIDAAAEAARDLTAAELRTARRPRLSDHPRHVAEEIGDRLKLRPQSVDNVRNKIRYASAWFDDELTKLEGAE
jgi:hypothetical protein